MTFLAGQKVTAAQLNEPIDDWVPYTPSLGSMTLGNGDMDASYKRDGNTVEVQVTILIGSTTSISGNITVGLPAPAAYSEGADGRCAVGDAHLLDSGTRRYSGGCYVTTSSAVALTHTEAGNVGVVNATNPFTWVSGDRIHLSITYEAA